MQYRNEVIAPTIRPKRKFETMILSGYFLIPRIVIEAIKIKHRIMSITNGTLNQFINPVGTKIIAVIGSIEIQYKQHTPNSYKILIGFKYFINYLFLWYLLRNNANQLMVSFFMAWSLGDSGRYISGS